MHLLKPRPCIWVLFLPAQLLCTNDREQGFSYKGTTIHRIVKGLYPMVILIFFLTDCWCYHCAFCHCHPHYCTLP